MKTDIRYKDDIALLIKAFYKKVRVDNDLAPFFQEITDWDAHFVQLTLFWESSLFLQTKYYGNPLEAHVKVDKTYGHTITEYHFGIWLNLWYQTIDELFEGEVAQNAKRRARKMGTFLYLKIFESRR